MKIAQTPSTVVVPAGRICPRCGAALGGFGPEGLCGACMFDSGLAADEPTAELDLLASGLRKFGDYELLEEIARGGMGVIFKARQLSLNRIVAVKMILRGEFADVTELTRFRAEAETAARLQHPNIVAIHEVGEQDGQPFFSMDYIEGQNLSQLVGNTPVPALRAAKYLKTIAEAVQYAHQRGVLHRDLKPSNILIDGSDEPRITDFGLAKHLEGDASLTITGQVLGSPNFMPPEQADAKSAAIGPASDVYSLGAILYHALTGRPPFVAESVPATLRLVSETEPVSPRLLNGSLPRDLETICLKCLQKEPERRYATAKELAEELNRLLNDEPIETRPIGQTARLWRWSRRNRALASAAAAVLVLLLTVAIGSPIAALRIQRERLRAEKALQQAKIDEQRAKSEAAKSQQVARFLQDMLGSASPWVVWGEDKTLLLKIVDKTAERVGTDLKDQPDVEASLRDTLGNVYQAINEFDKAEDMERQALAIRRQLYGNENLEVAESLVGLGFILRSAGKLDEAEKAQREGIAIHLKLNGPNNPEFARYILSLALTLRQPGKFEEAEQLHRQNLEILHSRPDTTVPNLAGGIAAYTYTLLLDRKFVEAEKSAREVLAINQKNYPDGWQFYASQNLLGRALLGQKRFDEAEPALLSAYEGLKEREATYPPTAFRSPVLEASEWLTELYEQTGKSDLAAEWRKRANEIHKVALEQNPAGDRLKKAAMAK